MTPPKVAAIGSGAVVPGASTLPTPANVDNVTTPTPAAIQGPVAPPEGSANSHTVERGPADLPGAPSGSPTPLVSLPFTGADVTGEGGLALALIGFGLFLSRRFRPSRRG